MIAELLTEVKKSIDRLNHKDIEAISEILVTLRLQGGRLFLVGSGGGAGHASHAACDFRKLCGIEAYSFDNITELTAQTNDEGWGTTTTAWLKRSNFNKNDCLFVFSVGGGDEKVSINLHSAILYAVGLGAKIIGIVGREKCSLTQYATASVVIQSEIMTPIVEGLQAVLWHLIVTKISINKTVW